MFYLIIFIVLMVLGLLNLQFRDKLSRQVLMLVSGMLLIAVAGLRYETGGDWDTYTKIFLSAPQLSSICSHPQQLVGGTIEGGFLLLCSIVRALGGGIQWLFFIVTLVDICLIAAVLPKYTRLPVVSMLAYFAILYFTLEMIYIRQATAVALCFFALQYVTDKKIWRYMLVIALACTFHRVAMLMVPLYFVLDKKLPLWIYAVVIGVGCLVMLTGVLWFRTLFTTLGSVLGGVMGEKIVAYIEEGNFAVARTLSIGFYINILLVIGILLFKDKLEQQRYGTVHLNMFMLSLVLYYYCYELIEVSNRARLFFLISVIVVLAELVENMGGFVSRLVAYGPVILYCFSFAATVMLESPSSAAYNPYQNYLVYKWTGKVSTGKARLEQSKRSFDNERRR